MPARTLYPELSRIRDRLAHLADAVLSSYPEGAASLRNALAHIDEVARALPDPATNAEPVAEPVPPAEKPRSKARTTHAEPGGTP